MACRPSLERFLGQCGRVTKRRMDVLKRDAIFTLYVLARHPASQASDHQRHGNTRTANHSLAMCDGGVNYYAV